ncbi:MAG TPA: hypothetical protein VK673_14960 [Chthoniobacterales bacterium]|nr:hypothetical protein [Chthoniobacterales bacterium]
MWTIFSGGTGVKAAGDSFRPGQAFQQLAAELEGEFHFDETMGKLYATDASVYRELPQAVALPKTEEDIGGLEQK